MIIKILISLMIGGTLLYLSVRNIEFANIDQYLENFHYEFLIILFPIFMAAHLLRGYRIKFIFAPAKVLSLKDSFAIYAVGYMGIVIIPLRLGEFIIPLLLHKNHDIPLGTATSGVFIERMVDFFVLLIILFSVMFYVTAPGWLMNSGYILSTLLTLLIVSIFFSYKFSTRLKRVFDFFIKRLPETIRAKIMSFLKNVKNGFKIIGKPSQLIKLIFLSFTLWGLLTLAIFTLFRMVNLQLGLGTALVVMVINIIGLGLPAGPGWIGNFQYSCILALSLFHIGKEQAFVFSNIYYITMIPLTVLLGAIFLTQINVNVIKSIKDQLIASKKPLKQESGNIC